MAAATVVRRYPDERIQRLHRSERPARVVGVSPAIRHAAPDQPIGVPPPPRLWGHAYCRWQSRGRCGPHLPRVRRLRMGSLLPGYCGAESRGWLLVPHHRSLHICPSLKSAAASPAQGGLRVDVSVTDPPARRSGELAASETENPSRRLSSDHPGLRHFGAGRTQLTLVKRPECLRIRLFPLGG